MSLHPEREAGRSADPVLVKEDPFVADLDEHGDVRIPEVDGGAGVEGRPETLLNVGGGEIVRTGAARPDRVAPAPDGFGEEGRARGDDRVEVRLALAGQHGTTGHAEGAQERIEEGRVRALDVEAAPAGLERGVDPLGIERIAKVGREPVLEARPRPARLGRELAGEPHEGPDGPGSEFMLRRHNEWQGGDLNPRPRAYESLALPG